MNKAAQVLLGFVIVFVVGYIVDINDSRAKVIYALESMREMGPAGIIGWVLLLFVGIAVWGVKRRI